MAVYPKASAMGGFLFLPLEPPFQEIYNAHDHV